MLQILSGILRKYRSYLPHSMWYEVCLHCIAAVEETLLGMESSKSSSALQTSWADPHTASHHDKQAASMVHAGRIILQQTLFVLFSVLHEPSPKCEHIAGRSLQDVKNCMLEQTGVASCVYAQGLLLEAVQFRRIVLQPPRSRIMVLQRVCFPSCSNHTIVGDCMHSLLQCSLKQPALQSLHQSPCAALCCVVVWVHQGPSGV